MPCGCCCYFCQVIYHHIYVAISLVILPDIPLPPSYGGPAKSVWHYESHSLDFTGECERRKTTACPWSSFSDSAHQEALCPRSRMLFLLSSFPHCTDWKHKPLSNMKMDSGKCVADGNFAMLRGISARRSAFCHPYILLYSITGLIFSEAFSQMLTCSSPTIKARLPEEFIYHLDSEKKIFRIPLCLSASKPIVLKTSITAKSKGRAIWRVSWKLRQADLWVYSRRCIRMDFQWDIFLLPCSCSACVFISAALFIFL